MENKNKNKKNKIREAFLSSTSLAVLEKGNVLLINAYIKLFSFLAWAMEKRKWL